MVNTWKVIPVLRCSVTLNTSSVIHWNMVIFFFSWQAALHTEEHFQNPHLPYQSNACKLSSFLPPHPLFRQPREHLQTMTDDCPTEWPLYPRYWRGSCVKCFLVLQEVRPQDYLEGTFTTTSSYLSTLDSKSHPVKNLELFLIQAFSLLSCMVKVGYV